MSHPPPSGTGRDGQRSTASRGVNSPRVGCCCTLKSDNRKVKRACSVCLGILKVAWDFVHDLLRGKFPPPLQSGRARAPRPRPRQGESPRELEALPTALISGSRQLCDPFSLSSRFSPVTYRLRDNSPTFRPPLQRRLLLHQEFRLLPALSIPLTLLLGSGKFGAHLPPAVSPARGAAAAGLLPALGAVPATAPALLCAVAGSSLAESLPRSRCPRSPPPRLAGAWSCSHLLLGDRHPHPSPPRKQPSPAAWHLSPLSQSKVAATSSSSSSSPSSRPPFTSPVRHVATAVQPYTKSARAPSDV